MLKILSNYNTVTVTVPAIGAHGLNDANNVADSEVSGVTHGCMLCRTLHARFLSAKQGDGSIILSVSRYNDCFYFESLETSQIELWKLVSEKGVLAA